MQHWTKTDKVLSAAGVILFVVGGYLTAIPIYRIRTWRSVTGVITHNKRQHLPGEEFARVVETTVAVGDDHGNSVEIQFNALMRQAGSVGDSVELLYPPGRPGRAIPADQVIGQSFDIGVVCFGAAVLLLVQFVFRLIRG